MSTGNIKGILDVRPDRVDLRDRSYRPPLISLPDQDPNPELALELLPRYLADEMILDQRKEGACTGFGLAAVINFLFWKRANLNPDGTMAGESGPTPRVSPGMLYHLARMYDEWDGEDYEGSSCRGAMKGWHRHGVCEDTLWSRPRKRRLRTPDPRWVQDAATRPLGAYYRIDKDSVGDMQAAIHEVGAIFVSAAVHRGWTRPKKRDEFLPRISMDRRNEGGHAFALVGYNSEGFIVQNSWGPTWGAGGFAVLGYEDWIKNGMDAWVAVMGSPVVIDDHRAARSEYSIQDTAAGRANWWWRGDSNEDPFSYRNPQIQPWDRQEAYHHSVVLGNDGRAINRILDSPDADAAVDRVTRVLPDEWLQDKAKSKKKIVLYAHGGLNDEDDSVNRVRILAPYFRENGVYPIFFTWKTGFLESITGILQDSVSRTFLGPRAEGIFSDAGEWLKNAAEATMNRLQDAKDRSVEVAAENLLVKAVWSQMKQNAAASETAGAGGRRTAHNIARLAKDHPGLEIHMIGHSAGSILLGHVLSRFVRLRTKVASVTLLAPACTIPFALRHYKTAIDKAVLKKSQLTVEILSDERERADSVGPYGKSLLYLVSRALEEVHKMPLLGLEAAWREGFESSIEWHRDKKRSVAQWRKFATDPVRLTVSGKSRSEISDGQGKIKLAHGSYDNDVVVMTRTLQRIVDPLQYKIESLRGF